MAGVSHKESPVGTGRIQEGKPSGEIPASIPSHALSVDTSFMWAQNIFLHVIPYKAAKLTRTCKRPGQKYDSG